MINWIVLFCLCGMGGKEASLYPLPTSNCYLMSIGLGSVDPHST